MHRSVRRLVSACIVLFATIAALPCAAQLNPFVNIGDALKGYWTGNTSGGVPIGLVIDNRGFQGTVGPDCTLQSTRIYYGDNRIIAADAAMACMTPTRISSHPVDIDLVGGELRLFVDDDTSARRTFTAGFTATLVRSLTSRPDTIEDTRIPGHWHGTSGDFSAVIDLDSGGRITGSVSGPGMDGCVFGAAVPPALAINQQGNFAGAGVGLMRRCADATLDVTYVVLLEATPQALTLRFVSALPDERGAFIVRGMTRDDAREVKAGMWQSPNESGWGLSIVTGDTEARTPFVVLFVYNGTSPSWYVMPGGAWSGDTHFEGDLYVTTGTDWRAPVFAPGTVTKVGRLAMTFSSDNAGTLEYAITDSTGTHSVTKPMQKQQF